MSDAPIKVCDFCDTQGKMPTYQNGMTICWGCQKSFPGNMQEALHEITNLRAQLAQAEGRCAKYENLISAALSDLEIMDEASGVAGYHLNGAITTWEEVGWSFMRDALQEASEKFEFAQRLRDQADQLEGS